MGRPIRYLRHALPREGHPLTLGQVGLPSVQEAEGILEEARAVGVGVLDTAHDYGLSEERIGAALQRVPLEERPIVVTKTANSNDAGSAEAATEIIARVSAT